jgi:hypothetical protein
MHHLRRIAGVLVLAGLIPACGTGTSTPTLSVTAFIPGAVVNPIDGLVPLECQIFIGFSSPLNPATVSTTNFIINPSGLPALSTTSVIYVPALNEVIITPPILAAGTTYVVTVLPGVTDTSGDAFAGFQQGFATTAGANADTTGTIFGGISGAAGNGAGSIQVSWAAGASNATGPYTYDVYISTVPGGEDLTFPYGGAGTPFQDPLLTATVSGLASGQSYWFIVRAHSSRGNQDRNTVEAGPIVAP